MEGEEEHFNAKRKNDNGNTILRSFCRDRKNIVITDTYRIGLRILFWQRQNDDAIRPVAFTSRYSNAAEKKYSIGELEQLAVLWGLEKFDFYT